MQRKQGRQEERRETQAEVVEISWIWYPERSGKACLMILRFQFFGPKAAQYKDLSDSMWLEQNQFINLDGSRQVMCCRLSYDSPLA